MKQVNINDDSGSAVFVTAHHIGFHVWNCEGTNQVQHDNTPLAVNQNEPRDCSNNVRLLGTEMAESAKSAIQCPRNLF